MDETADAFLRYVRPLWRRLYIVALRYVAREDQAHDLVQETLCRAWKGFSPTGETTYKRSWLFVIMRHVALDWQRASRSRIKFTLVGDGELTRLASDDPTERLSPLPAMDERHFREFLDDRITAALDALEPPFREVILLSVAAELNYREIADVLDCPVGTVMSRMSRARRALRERLGSFARATGWVTENQR